MSYTFRVVFSGPCAYIPNLCEGESRIPTSWSIVLPFLRDGWEGEASESGGDGVRVDRHLSVLKFDETEFYTSHPADVRLSTRCNDDSYRESALFLLDGHRLTFDFPGGPGLRIVDSAIEAATMGSQEEVQKLIRDESPLIRSLNWLPSMSLLCPGLEWFGRDGVRFFREDGYPSKGVISCHAIVDAGVLAAHELDLTRSEDGELKPTIWEFRAPPEYGDGESLCRQALARSICLEARDLEEPISIHISYSDSDAISMKLKESRCDGLVEVVVTNRELEEIFLPAGLEVEQGVDFDFRYMYTQAKGYEPVGAYPIPYLFKGGGGGGGERATCGGHRFSGFASKIPDFLREDWVQRRK